MVLSDVKKLSDRFSRFDTIPACDGHPASHPATQTRCRSKDTANYVAWVKMEIRSIRCTYRYLTKKLSFV